ncbi:MAG: 23S rRNA (guanosine(2251)-2'-O)-methyltransferase RlmB [Saprospiraceae bacterium]|nr:23S rRNA (guanosine(2251)-2'-O)-methyltransferase RlmB [Saprospiraceae bacterium]
MNIHKEGLICGRHPVLEAIKNNTQIDRILLQQGMRGEVEREFRHICKEYNIPTQFAPKQKLDFLAKKTNHQGIIALTAAVQYHHLADVLPYLFEQGVTPLILMLDGITDVRNFGAIARSAEVFGVHAIVIPQKGAAQINADAMKTSAGALNNVTVCRETSILTAVEFLQQSGVVVYASDLEAKKTIHSINFSIPCAIVIGSEGDGISKPVQRAAEELFVIPQIGKTGSLNVSVATGIMLYEVAKNRM